MQDEALEAIKQHGPVSAVELASLLNIGEKAARSKIDRLRAAGISIWHDDELGKFWFGETSEPSPIPYIRWKRRFPGRTN